MTERPILFSAPMVRALLAGTKTQTRRIVKVPKRFEGFSHPSAAGVDFSCPYGWRSDRLWVRETWGIGYPDEDGGYFAIPWSGADPQKDGKVFYRADFNETDVQRPWKPSIHMPRWASRINLFITDVRVERLQALSEADAVAEGIERISGDTSAQPWRDYSKDQRMQFFSAPSASYRSLWESINGPGSWDANPFVWVIEFKRTAQSPGEKV